MDQGITRRATYRNARILDSPKANAGHHGLAAPHDPRPTAPPDTALQRSQSTPGSSRRPAAGSRHLHHVALACRRLASRHSPQRDAAMPMLRIRLTGSDDDARAVINLLQSLEGIEHVEEV